MTDAEQLFQQEIHRLGAKLADVAPSRDLLATVHARAARQRHVRMASTATGAVALAVTGALLVVPQLQGRSGVTAGVGTSAVNTGSVTQLPAQAPGPILGAGPSGGPLVTPPSEGTTVSRPSAMAQFDGVETARSAAIEALLPPTVRFAKSHGEGRPGGRLYSEAEFTDGQVRLTAVWDRVAVPVSSTAVRGSTRTAGPNGTVVEERDEPGTPELLMVAVDGNSVDVSVTGDVKHVFDSTLMRSLAEHALAAG